MSNESDGNKRCVYCSYKKWFKHPKWVYLLSDTRTVNDKTTVLTGHQHIGLATHPHMRLKQHNREKGYHTGAKPTNLHGPHWQIELLIGPFYHMGREFKQEWRESSRGMESRYRYAYKMWLKWHHLNVFKQRNHPTLDGINKHEIIQSVSEEDPMAEDVFALANISSAPVEIYCRDPVFTQSIFLNHQTGSRHLLDDAAAASISAAKDRTVSTGCTEPDEADDEDEDEEDDD